jgi:hypothetical protein
MTPERTELNHANTRKEAKKVSDQHALINNVPQQTFGSGLPDKKLTLLKLWDGSAWLCNACFCLLKWN